MTQPLRMPNLKKMSILGRNQTFFFLKLSKNPLFSAYLIYCHLPSLPSANGNTGNSIERYYLNSSMGFWIFFFWTLKLHNFQGLAVHLILKLFNVFIILCNKKKPTTTRCTYLHLTSSRVSCQILEGLATFYSHFSCKRDILRLKCANIGTF